MKREKESRMKNATAKQLGAQEEPLLLAVGVVSILKKE